jgi:hypothetical protein
MWSSTPTPCSKRGRGRSPPYDIDQPAVPQQGLDPGETLEWPHSTTVARCSIDDEEPEPGPGRRADNGDDAICGTSRRRDPASQHYTFEADGQ